MKPNVTEDFLPPGFTSCFRTTIPDGSDCLPLLKCEQAGGFALPSEYWLSAPSGLKSMLNVFQHWRTWPSVVFNDAVDHIIVHFRELLFWASSRLTGGTVEEYAITIERKDGETGVWGLIDGTRRAICRLQEQQDLYYAGDKQFHMVKYRALGA